jgi:hypothetical protein
MENLSPEAIQNNGDGLLLDTANMDFPDRESLIKYERKPLKEKGCFISI